MKGLWIKDLKLMMVQKKSLFVILLVAVGILLFSEDVTFPIGYTSFLISISAVSTISYDEFDNGNTFLFTLPVSRKDYTLEKYLFSIIVGILAVICAVLLITIVTMQRGTFGIRLEDILITAAINIPILFLFEAIILPFKLKYEAEKGRIAMIAAIGAIVVILIFLQKTIFELLGMDIINQMINQLAFNETKTWITIYATAIILWFISLKISEKIMMNKEF